MRKLATIGVVVLLSAGCYHATIETGRPAATMPAIEIKWAHAFLWGLVPPTTVETAQKCPSGVAKVETQQSFLNLVANAVTGGIYSPMQITVTCAQGGTSDARTLQIKDRDEASVVLAEAVRISLRQGTPVYVALP